MQDRKNQANLIQSSENMAVTHEPSSSCQHIVTKSIDLNPIKSVSESFTGETDILEIYHNSQKRHLNIKNLLNEAFG